MTTPADIVNRALQTIGTRTTVSAAELAAGSSNEAVQASLVFTSTRDQLTRMAPWGHALTAAPLIYISSLPGTPENPGQWNGVWVPRLPNPPWTYMYEYPRDCLRALSIIDQPSVGGTTTPIFPCVTGYAPSHRSAIKFKVGFNKYRGGFNNAPTNPAGQVVGGFGPGFGPGPAPQADHGRVILTNQGQAVLTYVCVSDDPDNMDPLFQEAWIMVLGAKLALALTGDKALANGLVQQANLKILEARAYNADESVTVLDHTPDWLAVRGLGYNHGDSTGYDWGGLWPSV